MTIYRAISLEEKNDLETIGFFRPVPGNYEGKLFAESVRDASIFGKNFFRFDSRPFFIVAVEVQYDFRLAYEYPDQALGVGATIDIDREILAAFNQSITFVVLDYVEVI